MNLSIAVEHADSVNGKTTVINWCLGNTCNFSCSYCPESLHSGSEGWVNYDTAIQFCDNLIRHYKSLGQTIEFLFTGGEPTMYPHFPQFIVFLKNSGCRVGIISNGSRTIRYWEKIVSFLDFAFLTFHGEFGDIEHFINVVKLVNESIPVHVNVTMLPETFDQCLENAEKVFNDCPGISLSLKPLLQEFGSALYGYTPQQMDTLEKQVFHQSPEKKYKTRGLMKIIFEDGTFQNEKSTNFILKKLNNWNGWHCNIGIELIYIETGGDVYRGTCRQGGKITNIMNTAPFLFPSGTVQCSKSSCHCLTDIMITKNKYKPHDHKQNVSVKSDH